MLTFYGSIGDSGKADRDLALTIPIRQIIGLSL